MTLTGKEILEYALTFFKDSSLSEPLLYVHLLGLFVYITYPDDCIYLSVFVLNVLLL